MNQPSTKEETTHMGPTFMKSFAIVAAYSLLTFAVFLVWGLS